MTAEDKEKQVHADDAPQTEAESRAGEMPEAEETAATRQTEEPGTASKEEADQPEAEVQAESEDQAEADGQMNENPQDEAEPEQTAQDPSDAPEDVVDGDFRTVDEKEGKGSFFRRKKDKKDERIEELSDQVKRQMAEFDNFRKRTEREKSQMFDLGVRSVIEKLLPTVDNFERGLASAGEDSEDPFVQGMEKVYKQLLQELEAIGVTPIEAEGKEFDPDYHNAVMHCEDESVGANIIVQELQKGYLYHDTVVRYSMVKVAN